MQRQLLSSLLAALLLTPLAVRADLGVSDARVSLPDGPGSVGGVGENVSASDNMGALTYEVGLEVPEGFSGATPKVSLRYSSLGGNGEVGMGWELGIPHIERFSLRGLPRYDNKDVFAADGGDELVRVSSEGSTHVYRARFEGGFVRYTWHADAAGAAGYWEGEYPDGSRGFFGADASGEAALSARMTQPGGAGVFRYMLVESVDRFGHRVRYDYRLDGLYPLVYQITYLFTQGDARYGLQFAYEGRCDGISSALPSFEWWLTERLSKVSVLSEGRPVRHYLFQYADGPPDEKAQPGGCDSRLQTSLLQSVRKLGADGEPFPIAFNFAYSASLDLGCSDCERPFLRDMGQLAPGVGGGVDLQNGLSTLLDINGDSLPDILHTTLTGEHHFFLNTMASDRTQSFSAPQDSAQTPNGSSFVLSSPGVQVVDINGDGFADMIDAAHGQLLCNQGEGDWASQSGPCGGLSLNAVLQDDPTETGEANPLGMRFMDYDGDKRIDILHTVSIDSTQVWRNTPLGFEPSVVEALGKVFDDASTLQLADVNGDGLLDPVEVSASGSLWYRLNLGLGRWKQAEFLQLEGAFETLEGAELQDLNGDGLDDVVLVRGNAVQYALNQAGRFLPFEILGSDDVQGELPTVTDQTTVLFADMNGSGSTDVVWVESGRVRFLELFALRPNLLTRIDNDIGGVQSVQYGTSAQEQARDLASGRPWRHRLPLAMNLVTATERYATLTPKVTQRVERSYHDGFYDGLEKRYRGFESLEEHSPGDATQQAVHREFDYDVGALDPYKQGRRLCEQVFGGEATQRHPLQRTLYGYDDCPVAEVEGQGLRVPVRHVCQTRSETLLQEDRAEADWVTLRREQEYDGYGNVVRASDLGVVGLGRGGAQGCGPCQAPEGTSSAACGAACLGDEAYTETQYIPPTNGPQGRWLLGVPKRRVTYSDPNGSYTETLSYYDGTPFIGLARGKLTQGLLTRQCERKKDDDTVDCEGDAWVYSTRAEYDVHGNVTAQLDPLGSPADMNGHRRHIEYDRYGLKVSAVEMLLSADDKPYRLRREISYDPLFDQPSAVTRWILQDTKLSSTRGEMRIAYDAFGRRSRIAEPGDTLDQPTHAFAYELSAPVSRIVVSGRSKQGKAADLESLQCLDGLGRIIQTRTRLSEGHYQVTGFHEVNPQNMPVRVYQAYQGGRDCDLARPQGVPFSRHDYDALGRSLRVTSPDKALYGEASVSSTEYGPLSITRFDAEDNDPNSPAYNTPERSYTDGLGRLVRTERELEPGSERGVVQVLWDDLGRLAGYVDANGHRKRQSYDLLGRVVRVDDPNAGVTRSAYDDAGNLIAATDARGKTVRTVYDGGNRAIAQFDDDDRQRTLVQTRYDFSPQCRECKHAEGQAVSRVYPLGANRGTGLDEHGFDLRGQNTLFARSLEGHRFVTTTAYDNAGRVVRWSYPDGTVLDQAYDGASRLISIDGVVDDVLFDARGLVRELRYANGNWLEQQHDVLQRLRTARTYGKDGSVLLGLGYVRDRQDNLLRVDDLSDLRVGRLPVDVAFDHDAWYRTTQANFGNGTEVVKIGFDLVDNITRKVSSIGEASGAHVGDYQIDERRPNAVGRAGELAYDYDAAGRVTRRAGTQLDWDHLGRVERAEALDGRVGEYVYGHGMERVMELHDGGVTYYAAPNFEVRDGISVIYARTGGNRVARLSSKALSTAILDDLNGDARVDVGDAWMLEKQSRTSMRHLRGSARRLLLETGEEAAFLHADHLGSLTLVTGGDGAVLGEQTFYPTGALREQRNYVDSYGFTGQRVDPTTGMTHFSFRELDNVSGRWASPDPLFAVSTPERLAHEGQATTAYAYVAGRLASLVDPTGLIGRRTAAVAIMSLMVASHVQSSLAFSANPVPGSNPVPGVAVISLHDPVHFAVKVVADGKSLTSHQMRSGEHSWVHSETSLSLSQPKSSAKFFLPDAASAMDYQNSLIGKDVGPYDRETRSCVTHVCSVLKAGGAAPPSPKGPDQILYLLGQIYGGVTPGVEGLVRRRYQQPPN